MILRQHREKNKDPLDPSVCPNFVFIYLYEKSFPLQQLRDTSTARDEAKLEMERLNEGIRQSRVTHDDCVRQQHAREQELADLVRTLDEREIEYQETRKVGTPWVLIDKT